MEASRQQVARDRRHAEAIADLRARLDRLWATNRSLANDAFDEALADVAEALPGLEVHAFPSGSLALDWEIPPRWELRSARVVDERGRVVIDAAEQPLHVVAYSLPKHGRVARDELLAHLHSDPEQPDAIPYHFAFYERDWGLCCSDRVKRSLEGNVFDVELDTELSEGELHVGEYVLTGSRRECVLFVGHLDHPMQANDGLLGALVLVELARELARRGDRLWSYRFLFVPERIGSIAWVDRFPEVLPDVLGGVMCEMPGVPGQALSLQLSRWGDTKIDCILRSLLRTRDPDAPVLPCWKHVVNDDGVLNAPGVDLPVASVSRSAPGGPFTHFPEYHTDRDTPELVDWDGVAETLAVLLELCEILESDRTPKPTYAGEPHLSRHGLWVDWRTDPELNLALEDVYHRFDGRTSLFEIADATRLTFAQVAGFAARMEQEGLLELAPADRFYARGNGWADVASRVLPEGVRQAGA